MNQNLPGADALAIAQQLLTYEAGPRKSSGVTVPAATSVCEKLRRPLSILAGSTGFQALLGRALTLAKVQDPRLGAVQIRPDGSLDGLGELTNKQDGQAGVVLIAQLLGLLEAFIGPDLTMRLVADVWPDLPTLQGGSQWRERK